MVVYHQISILQLKLKIISYDILNFLLWQNNFNALENLMLELLISFFEVLSISDFTKALMLDDNDDDDVSGSLLLESSCSKNGSMWQLVNWFILFSLS